MAIQVGTTAISSNVAAEYLFQVKEFMKNVLSWTVEGSGDGISSGGMDQVDRITTSSVFNDPQSWLVIQSPHAVAGDRIQIMFDKDDDANSFHGSVRYNPNADWTGGTGTTRPTSSYDRQVVSTNIATGTNVRIQLLGQDTPPYGVAAYVHEQGAPDSGRWAFSVVPLTQQAGSSPGKPYAVYASVSGVGFVSLELRQDTTSTISAGAVAERPNPPNVPSSAPLLTYESSLGPVAPDNVTLDDDGNDLGFPIMCASRLSGPSSYYGVSDFMRWTGTNRGSLTTFNNRSRIVFNDVSFPWDGTTQPNPN